MSIRTLKWNGNQWIVDTDNAKSWWLIAVADAESHAIVVSRWSSSACTPIQACEQAFGRGGQTPNMWCFRLGRTLTEARRTNRKIPDSVAGLG